MPRIAVRMGAVEVEYEGEQEFIASGLLQLIQQIGEHSPPVFEGASHEEGQGVASANSGSSLGHTTSQIAQICDVSTGPDLAMAAAAHLTLVGGKNHLQRSEILKEMKDASAFYNENYSSNLSAILNGLVKKKQLSPIGANVFALPNSMRKEYEKRLQSE